MTREAILDVLAKALADDEFSAQLFSDPSRVLSDFDLSEDELDLLGNLQKDAFEALSFEVEQRISAVTPIPVPEANLASWKEHIIRNELKSLDLGYLLQGDS
jgi:hypothetical protein